MHYVSLFGKKGSKVKVTRIVRRKYVEVKEKRFTLAQTRIRNAKEYKYEAGRATIWPPLPGTGGADDFARICNPE